MTAPQDKPAGGGGHTAGSWSLREGFMIDAPTFKALASVRSADLAFEGEASANARLIAAAPDLLEALTDILAEASGMSMTMRRRAIFNKGHVAIAKATAQ